METIALGPGLDSRVCGNERSAGQRLANIASPEHRCANLRQPHPLIPAQAGIRSQKIGRENYAFTTGKSCTFIAMATEV